MNVTYGSLTLRPEWHVPIIKTEQDYVGSPFGEAIDIAIGVLQASLVFWPLVAFFVMQSSK